MNGYCTFNSTLAVCKKGKAKVAIIAGVVGGVLALVLAGIAAAALLSSRGAAPIGAGAGADPMATGLLQNPIYSQNAGGGENPMYAGL